MKWPDLTICILTCRRPWYAAMTLSACRQIAYAGNVKWHLADGGTEQRHFKELQKIIAPAPMSIEVVDNPSRMVNSCAHHGGDLWIMAVDDMLPRRPFDITPDVRLLLTHEEIGCVRMSRLAYWGSFGQDPETSADLVECGGLHWWRLDKARTKDSYVCNIGFHLYHRRFWDAYGDLEEMARENELGHAEMIACERFRKKEGPTIAVPMRFGEDALGFPEPIWHFGTWRTDELAAVAHTRL